MTNFRRILITVLIIAMNVSTPVQADTAVASFNISGNVPTVFSLTARGYPGDLDLNPGTVVADRLIGILHFKYNVAIATLTVASDTASGLPEDAGGNAYDFAPGGDMVFEAPGCVQIDAADLDGTNLLTQAGVDVLDAGAPAMAENDCDLVASWTAATTIQPAGKYSMTVTFTMVSI